MTRKSVAKSEPIATSTMLALRSGGSLKACTPFDTASVPVSATEPDAKARRTRSSVSACVPSFANGASGAAATGTAPLVTRSSPTPSSPRTDST